MSEITYPTVALGAWAWGNDGTFGGGLSPEDVRPVFDAARTHGLNLWDTAYAYGMGTSERTLAGFLADLPRESYLVSDKFTPQCADPDSKTPVADMITRQLELMGLDRFDIYWIHNPVGAPRYTEEMARYFEGSDDAPVIGVSNHNLAEIRQADEILRAHGLRLGAVQNHYSLINRSSETSGILDWCREHDAAFFAYMVLEQGALTGKYTTANPMPADSTRGETYNPIMDKLEIMNAEIARVAEAHGVKPAQVPVAWAIAKGTLPLIGVTKPGQVDDAAEAAKVELSADEVAGLECVADSLGLDVIRFWEKVMD